MAVVINGIVPNPKNNIYKPPSSVFPVAIAVKTAIYTKLQDRNPFKKSDR